MVSGLVNYDSLLKNATDIVTKYNSHFVTNYEKSLLRNVLRFYLKSATIYRQSLHGDLHGYYKMCRFQYESVE